MCELQLDGGTAHPWQGWQGCKGVGSRENSETQELLKEAVTAGSNSLTARCGARDAADRCIRGLAAPRLA